MKLNNKQIRHLKSLARDLKPIVIIGDKGLSQAVLDEIGHALNAHELMKIKIRADEREEREEMIETIVQKTGASYVQRVGHIVTIFKRHRDPKIALPK